MRTVDFNNLVHFRQVDADASALTLKKPVTNGATTQRKGKYVRPQSVLLSSSRQRRG